MAMNLESFDSFVFFCYIINLLCGCAYDQDLNFKAVPRHLLVLTLQVECLQTEQLQLLCQVTPPTFLPPAMEMPAL